MKQEVSLQTVIAVLGGIAALIYGFNAIGKPYAEMSEHISHINSNTETIEEIMPMVREINSNIHTTQSRLNAVEDFINKGDRFTIGDGKLLESKIDGLEQSYSTNFTNLKEQYTSDMGSLREFISVQFLDIKTDIAELRADKKINDTAD